MTRGLFANALFIARKDVAFTLRDRYTLVWLVLMPPLFFYFIGTATGGFGAPEQRDRIAVQLPQPSGFLAAQLVRRLDESGFEVVAFGADQPLPTADDETPSMPFEDYCRRLVVPRDMTAIVVEGGAVAIDFDTCADELRRDFDEVRVQRAVYTTLADVVAVGAGDGGLDAAAIERLNAQERALTLTVRPAGKRRDVPQGFQQAVPGTMVLFTMLILLTSGAMSLMLERHAGLLRRLASAPMRRRDIVLGKWLGKMALAICQIAFAMVVGRVLFDVDWQPDLPMILLVLLAWAGVCTSCGLLLGSIGRTEGQVAGIGVLLSMLLAGLGGCWWPIEVAPPWMQSLAGLLPTGWTMNALHRLMSFEAGPASVLPEFALLLVTAVVVGALAVRRFRFE